MGISNARLFGREDNDLQEDAKRKINSEKASQKRKASVSESEYEVWGDRVLYAFAHQAWNETTCQCDLICAKPRILILDLHYRGNAWRYYCSEPHEQ